jgi:hypothetical protein
MPTTTKRKLSPGGWRLILSLWTAVWAVFAGAAWSAPAEPSQQEILALEYRLNIDRTPAGAAAEKEKLFLRLIEECPETDAAEEAYWALSNLYLDDFDEPQEDKAREILESFLKRYPASQWVLHVESRLAWLQGKNQ